MFQLWKIHGVMKFGWRWVTAFTSSSNSCHSFRFCFSMAPHHRKVMTGPRAPTRLSRATLPAISGSPWSSSRSSSRSAWPSTELDVSHSDAATCRLNGTAILPRQNRVTVKSAAIPKR